MPGGTYAGAGNQRQAAAEETELGVRALHAKARARWKAAGQAAALHAREVLFTLDPFARVRQRNTLQPARFVIQTRRDFDIARVGDALPAKAGFALVALLLAGIAAGWRPDRRPRVNTRTPVAKIAPTGVAQAGHRAVASEEQQRGRDQRGRNHEPKTTNEKRHRQRHLRRQEPLQAAKSEPTRVRSHKARTREPTLMITDT